MTSPESVRRIAHDILTPMLEALGFKRREAGIFTIDLGDDFLGWIGLPDTVRHGAIAINPVVGLRHQKVQEILAELLGDRRHPYLPPTLTKGLGFLLSEQKSREWCFDSSDPLETYEGFAAIVRDVALPFMRQHANLAALDAMLGGYEYVRFQIDQRERLPVIKYLRGDFVGAVGAVEQNIVEIADRHDARSDAYRQRLGPALIERCKLAQALQR